MVHIPNIEKALKIEVEKSGLSFRADAKALPGTPIVGCGLTEDAAKYNLCVNLLYILARPDDGKVGGDRGYKPIISKLLTEDLNNAGRVL
jgi:hypothetical protein